MSEATAIEYSALIGALEFYIESGVRDFCTDDANDMASWKANKGSFLPKATTGSAVASGQPISASQLRAEVNAEAAIEAEQAAAVFLMPNPSKLAMARSMSSSKPLPALTD